MKLGGTWKDNSQIFLMWVTVIIEIVHTEGRAGLEIEGNSISSVLVKFGQFECEVPIELLSR